MTKIYKNIWVNLLVLLPVVLYFALLYKYARNIPYLDDYDSILGFIINYLKLSSFNDRIQLIFSQHNDHRIAFAHFITLLQYLVLDEINFKYLILFGNLSIIGILITLGKSSIIWTNKPYYMLPVVYMLFSFRYYEASLWAMVSLSGLCVVAFSLAAIFLLDKKGCWYFIGSCLLSTFAMYTQGNGILVLVCGFLLLILKNELNKAGVWVCFSLLLASSTLLFKSSFSGYPGLLTVLKSPQDHIISFFSFLGMFLGNFKASLMLGFAVVLYFIYLCLVKYYNKNALLFVMLFYILLNALAVGYARPSVQFPSRYSIYSVLAATLIYMILVENMDYSSENITIKCIQKLIIGSSILFYLFYIPLVLQYYQISVKSYERNIVDNHLINAGTFREKANLVLNEDLRNMPSSRELILIPHKFISYYISNKRRDIKYVMTENHWWLTHVNSFSITLADVNAKHIYNQNNMLLGLK